MKKQYFISLAITCMVIFNVKAQNTPIDDFLKKYPSMEGVTNVSMSQQMLQSVFARPKQPQENPHAHDLWMKYKELNIPEAYSSISISKTDFAYNMFNDFKKILLSSKYDLFMEVNKENSDVLSYYIKETNNSLNDIVVLRKNKDQISAIYIKGNIEMRQVDDYLNVIKLALVRMRASNQTDLLSFGNQFAFSMPSFDDFNFPNFKEFDFKFDTDAFNFKMDENFQLRLEESMKKAKDMMESEDFKIRMEESKLKMDESMQKMKELFESEDFQNKIKDSKNGIIE